MCCSVLQCVAVCCSVVQCDSVFCSVCPPLQGCHLFIWSSGAHCNTLQHTATLCNTPQHTPTYCNTLHHTATRCNTLQHTLTHWVRIGTCTTWKVNWNTQPLHSLRLVVHNYVYIYIYIYISSIITNFRKCSALPQHLLIRIFKTSVDLDHYNFAKIIKMTRSYVKLIYSFADWPRRTGPCTSSLTISLSCALCPNW